MPQRYCSDLSLPRTTYVPGRSARPSAEAHAALFDRAAIRFSAVTAADSREYLLGLDLFNSGYYWEAHEVWETLWISVGRAGVTADFLKALIKLAAAGVKAYEGRANGVRRHAGRATELLEHVNSQNADAKLFAGLHVETLLAVSRSIAIDAESIAEAGRSPPCPDLIATLSLQDDSQPD